LISHIKKKVEIKTVSEQSAVENIRIYIEVTGGSKKQYNEGWYCSPTNNKVMNSKNLTGRTYKTYGKQEKYLQIFS
jgi:hypothetical protein